MSLFLLFLSACASCGMPDEIPDKPGTVEEAELPDLLTVVSPDLPVNLWLVVAQLSGEDVRDCPEIYWSGSTLSISAGTGDGCLDSALVTWKGSASASSGGGGSLVMTFNDFGPVDGVSAPWSANGTVSLEGTESGVGTRVSSAVTVTSLDPGGERVLYNETQMGLTYYDSVLYADHFYGTVGLGSWGTAEIDGNRVPLGLANGCAYARHYAGSVSVFGKNEAVFSFKRLAALAGPPPPAEGDSGGGDSGGDTDTDTDTDPDDTDTNIPLPTGDAEGLCGDCTAVAIDGTALPTCVEPVRSVDWPFFAPF